MFAQKAEVTVVEAQKPKHWNYKVEPGQIKFVKKAWTKPQSILPDPDQAPDASLHRGNVFLTSMNVEDNEILKLAQMRKQEEVSYE